MFGQQRSSYCFCHLNVRGLNDLKNHMWLMIKHKDNGRISAEEEGGTRNAF